MSKRPSPNFVFAVFTIMAIFATLYLTVTVADTIARYALSTEFAAPSPPHSED